MKSDKIYKQDRKFDLENRLIDFAIRVSDVAESLPNNPLGKYLKDK